MMMTPAGRRRPAPLCVCDLWSLGARIFEIPAQHPKTTNDYYYYYDYFDSWVVVGERRSSPRRLKDKCKRVSCIVHVYVPQHEKREIWKNFILGPPPLKTKAKWE
jgi:hypothetical protein